MATYAKEKGFTVQTLSTDPVASQAAVGSWSSGENLPGTRQVAFSAGTRDANLVSGGASTAPANSNQINTTVKYDEQIGQRVII